MLSKVFLFTLVLGTLHGCCMAGCGGTLSASVLPYILQLTTTGDAKSTTFVMTICNRLCKSSAICSPLANLTVGASGVTTYPASSLTSCGPTWSGSSLGSLASQAPSATMHCESFYMTTSISNAKVTDVCGGTPCNVRLTLSSGTTASTTVSGNTLYLGGFPQTPTPYGPTPYGPTPYGPTPHGRRLSAYQNQSSVPGRRF